MDSSSKPSHQCMACQVGFSDPESQREHYKTDWHRYNLKRKVAEMAPVSKEIFDQRMATHEAQMKLLSGETKEPTGYCAACRKSFNTQKAYENHLASKKHKETAAKFDKKEDKDLIENNRLNRKPSESTADAEEMEEDIEVEEVDSDEWDEFDEGGDPVPVTDCVFCSHHSRDLERNLVHMTEKHSFFLPDADYLVDLEGMMTYLGEKVGQGLMCLYCNERSKHFQSLSAVQRHMEDKQHCRIKHDQDALLEYSRFYDFTASYPDADGGEGGEEGEDAVELNQIDDSGYELVLPSGARVGHRSLMRYYRYVDCYQLQNSVIYLTAFISGKA